MSTKLDNKELKVLSAKNELIKVSRHFYSKGWMMGTSGNLSILIEKLVETPQRDVSAAISFEFLITASGKDKGELTEDDFLLVNEGGKAVQTNELKPSAETLLHAAIYKLTEAKAIYHVHTTNVTLLSMSPHHPAEGEVRLGRPTTPPPHLSFTGLEMLKGLGFKTHDVTVNIPIIENSQDMEYIASIAHDYIDENVPGLILRGHGIYAWGKTPEEAKRHVEIFEFLCDYKVKELSIL